MPHNAGLLLARSFLVFLLFKDVPLHVAASQKFGVFECENGRFLPRLQHCDGKDDCGDNSDERNCDYAESDTPREITSHFVPFHCVYTNITYMCKFTETCIPLEKFCDLVRDCPDGSDEYEGCERDVKCVDKYKCSDGHCIRKSWRCDGMRDCPGGSDEFLCGESLASECTPVRNKYQCKNTRCISLDAVCNNMDDCGDLSDEHNCSSTCQKNCEQKCKITPAGPVCTCAAGFQLKNETFCEDIDECKTFGICDQFCENTKGSYKCSCKEDYTLQDDRKTCRAIDHYEATLYFTHEDEVREVVLDSRLHVLAYEVKHHFIASMAMKTENLMYWSSGRAIYLVNLQLHSVHNVVTTGLENIQEIAVDWITGNLYFADWDYLVGACTHNGSYCVKLMNTVDHPITLALSPTNGVMFVSYTHDKLLSEKSYITKASMDGTNETRFVSDLKYPCGMTVDHITDRLYWVDSKFYTIESIRIDGTDLRVLRTYLWSNPISISVFENYVYWSSNLTTDIEFCNKFTGKDWETLYQADHPLRHLQVFHPAARPKMKNPCERHPCAELCLLNSNKSYTCACTSDKKLVNNTCIEELKDMETVIAVSSMHVAHYHHEFIGDKRMFPIPSYFHFTEATCNPITGDIIMYDIYTVRALRYNPRSHRIADLMYFNDMVQGMAVDYIGNNLITSHAGKRAIEVYSMTTRNKTMFYFKDIPTSIAVVPEKGVMFVVFKNESSNRVERVPMNNIHARTRFILKDFNARTMVSLFYDRYTKMLFVGDYLSGSIALYNIEESHFSTNYYFYGYDKVTSIAVTKNYVYWTREHSSELYGKNKIDILMKTIMTFSDRSVVEIEFMHSLSVVTVQYQIQDTKIGCRDNNGNCSHVCLPTSASTYICACPPGTMLSANNRTCETLSACQDNGIRCTEHNVCIKHEQWCDGSPDCPSNEDEAYGCKQNSTCTHGHFRCKNGQCVSLLSRCNYVYDCQDKSDEDNCKRLCTSDEFQCNNECLPMVYVCDGMDDCLDSSDETDCANMTCHSNQFRCNTGQCITKSWECDQEEDCRDGSDEHRNCTASCEGENLFKCANGLCISQLLQCNDFNDCGDYSDEMMCANQTHIRHTATMCRTNEQRCVGTSTCISTNLVCDGVRNCPQGEDELMCDTKCHEQDFACRNGQCIFIDYKCNGETDCEDGSDEENCSGNAGNATSGECEEYACSDGRGCLGFSHVCDGHPHCHDASDENGECVKACTSQGVVTCDHICHKTPNGGACRCVKGYYLDSDKTSCKDVNECAHDVCSQNCWNILGSYECSCYDGYDLRLDGISCKALGPPIEYILATSTGIKKLLHSYHLDDVLSEDTTVLKIDVNDVDGNIYWISEYYGTLNKLDVKTKKLSTMKGFRPLSLAVDSLFDNVYVSNEDEIKVCNVEQNKCATLKTTEKEEVITKIIIDVNNRHLYWIAHKKDVSEIVRSDMIGRNNKTIVQDTGIANSLAIDSTKSRLYWLRLSQKIVESSDLDGYHRKTILHLKEPISDMYIFENEIYSISNGLLRCKLYNNNECNNFDFDVMRDASHFAIRHVSKLPRETKTRLGLTNGNSCSKMNCSFMCVITAQSTCICEDGTPIEVNTPCVSGEEHSKNAGKQRGIVILSLLFTLFVLGLLYYCHQQEFLNCWRRVRTDNTILSFRNLLYNHNTENLIDSVATSSVTDPVRKSADKTPRSHEYVNPFTSEMLQPQSTRNYAKEQTESMDSEETTKTNRTLINIE